MKLSTIALALFMALPSTAFSIQVAEGLPEHQKLMDHSPVFQESFGHSVAVSGEWTLVYEPGNRTAPNPIGTIFVYERDSTGWVLRQEITPAPNSDPWSWSSLFGDHIQLDGATAAVTYTSAHNYEGSIAILERVQGTWQVTQEIRSPNPDSGELFGHSMAISGDTLIVGAPTNADQTQYGGAVHFYQRIQGAWQFQQTLHGNDPFTYPRRASQVGSPGVWQFYTWQSVGTSVAIHGDVAVASFRVVTSEMFPGALGKAFVFERINGIWQQTDILWDPLRNSSSSDQFGRRAIEIDGDQILIGDGHADTPLAFGVPDPGEVVVFQRSAPGSRTWSFLQKFSGSNASIHWEGGWSSDGFGESISLHGDRLLVGASRGKRRLTTNNIYGEAYLFERDSNGLWSEIEHYRHSDWNHRNGTSPIPGFGRTVALGDNYAVVGHPIAYGTGDTLGAGAVYVFEQPHGDAYCPGPENSTGTSATLTCTGNLDPTVGILTLWADDMPPGEVGLLLASPAQGFTPNPGGSLGDLCLGGPLARVTAQLSDASGRARFATNPLAIPTHPTGAIQSGETWYFQAWYRDQWLGTTSNFTEALSVSFP